MPTGNVQDIPQFYGPWRIDRRLKLSYNHGLRERDLQLNDGVIIMQLGVKTTTVACRGKIAGNSAGTIRIRPFESGEYKSFKLEDIRLTTEEFEESPGSDKPYFILPATPLRRLSSSSIWKTLRHWFTSK